MKGYRFSRPAIGLFSLSLLFTLHAFFSSWALAVACNGKSEVFMGMINSNVPKGYKGKISLKVDSKKDVVGFCYRDDSGTHSFDVDDIEDDIVLVQIPGIKVNVVTLKSYNFSKKWGGKADLHFLRRLLPIPGDSRKITLDIAWNNKEKRWVFSVHDKKGTNEIDYFGVGISTIKNTPYKVEWIQLWKGNKLVRDYDTDDLPDSDD